MSGADDGSRPVAIVTGASEGIGRATARALGRAGFEVLVHYRSHRSDAEAVAEAVRAAGGVAGLVAVDLARPDEVDRWGRALSKDPRPLHALVHNGGDYPRVRFDDLSPEEVRRVLEVHLVAPLELTRRLAPRLARAAPGAVVFVSSILASIGSAHGAHYAAAKAAQIGAVRSLARELAPGIRVNAVAPGSIDTAILAGDTPARRADRERAIPLGRLGTPEEVADAILFLVSPASRYITGSTLSVNGGIAAP